MQGGRRIGYSPYGLHSGIERINWLDAIVVEGLRSTIPELSKGVDPFLYNIPVTPQISRIPLPRLSQRSVPIPHVPSHGPSEVLGKRILYPSNGGNPFIGNSNTFINQHEVEEFLTDIANKLRRNKDYRSVINVSTDFDKDVEMRTGERMSYLMGRRTSALRALINSLFPDISPRITIEPHFGHHTQGSVDSPAIDAEFVK